MQAPSPTANDNPPVTAPGLLVIVGGGTVDTRLVRLLEARGAVFVGADGGGDVIAEAGFTPEAIIGDMDSLANPEAWAERSRVIRIEEQETTDLEKCLYSTAAPVTVILGATGRRFDHTLAALDAVAKYGRERHIILVDETDLAFAVSGPFAFEADAGARVSIHPLAPVRFAHSEGLRYVLDGLTLAPGRRGGTSNEVVGGPFRIEPEEGETGLWLLILDLRYLTALLDRLTTQ